MNCTVRQTAYLPNDPCPRPLFRRKKKKKKYIVCRQSHKCTNHMKAPLLHLWRPMERVSCVLAVQKHCPRIELLLEKLLRFRSSALPLVLRFHFDVCSLMGSQVQADTEPHSPKLISPQKQSFFFF